MLANCNCFGKGRPLPIRKKQGGVVLMIALIVLVGMTLAGLALVRSMDTSNIIAGNLAFQQAATQAGDAGSEVAIAWLETNNGGGALYADAPASGYSASWQPALAANQTWDNYWQTVLNPVGGPSKITSLPTDPITGNTVSYAIQRLCNTAGDPHVGAGCAFSAETVVSNTEINSNDSDAPVLSASGQVYYRITSRIQGPRNTVSYVQTIVAL